MFENLPLSHESSLHSCWPSCLYRRFCVDVLLVHLVFCSLCFCFHIPHSLPRSVPWSWLLSFASNASLFFITIFIYLLCVHICMHVCVWQRTSVRQRTIGVCWLSSYILWVPGIKLRSSGLTVRVLNPESSQRLSSVISRYNEISLVLMSIYAVR